VEGHLAADVVLHHLGREVLYEVVLGAVLEDARARLPRRTLEDLRVDVRDLVADHGLGVVLRDHLVRLPLHAKVDALRAYWPACEGSSRVGEILRGGAALRHRLEGALRLGHVALCVHAPLALSLQLRLHRRLRAAPPLAWLPGILPRGVALALLLGEEALGPRRVLRGARHRLPTHPAAHRHAPLGHPAAHLGPM